MSKKVLIIEDEAPLSQIISDALQAESYEVDIAGDGMEGLQKIKDGKPDLVLLDIMMPKLDGRQMLEQLRAMPEFKNMHIIVLTNVDSDINVISDVVVNGGHDYLIKANTPIAQIVERVKQRLG